MRQVSSTHQPAPEPTAQRLPQWRGFNLTEKFTHLPQKAFLESDFAMLRELGFDYARLALSYRCWTTPQDWRRIDERCLREIDAAVDWGRQYGVHVDLSFHRLPGFCVNNDQSEPFDLFADAEALEAAAYQWTVFAERYRGLSNARVTFNLFNEPIAPAPEAHLRVVTRLVETIREADPDRLMIADGARWGRVPQEQFIPLKIAQATHPYDPIHLCFWRLNSIAGADRWPEPTWPLAIADDDPQWAGPWDRDRLHRQCVAPWKSIEAQGVGIHASELGVYNRTPHAAACAYLRDMTAVLDAAGWGYALWNFRGEFGILDSQRTDVRYESFHGHQLDRRLTEILLRND